MTRCLNISTVLTDMSVPRPHLALSRSQSSLYPDSMKTLSGSMTLWLRQRTMLD